MRARTARTCPRRTARCASCARHIDEKFADRMLLAEANQWPEDAVAYFGDGDECHMAFHFPLMPRHVHGDPAWRTASRSSTSSPRRRRSPTSCQWAIFLRNHDELTLEMVTDEERDYMYRVYADDPQARINLGIRRRLAPLLGNDRRRDRADERPAALAARHAGHLLRRRDRDGRQHLPRRPQRRAHADAVEPGPQRAASPRATRSGSTCPSSSTPSTTTRRSTSRRSRPTRTRCSGG